MAMGVAKCFILVLVIQSGLCDRWSRQLQNNVYPAAPENDWIPLPDRAAGAKVLNFQPNQHKSFSTQTFHNHNRPLDNSNAPSQYNIVGEPFKFVTQNRYVFQQPQAQQLVQPQPSAFPQYQGLPQNTQGPSFLEQSNEIARKPFAEALVQDNTVFNQFQQNDLRSSNHPNFLPQPQPSQISTQYQFQQPQQQPRQLPQPQQQPQQQDEVQLVYVPLDTLNQQNYFKNTNSNNRYNVLPPQVNAAQINDFYTSAVPTTTTTIRPITTQSTTTYRPNVFRSTESPAFTSKPKPHQPPLSMFLLSENADTSVSNVLNLLKNARNIAVLDSIDENETTPRVFIGPTGLEVPAGYVKFDLPYLSSIEQNRSERKLQHLPFFVAPLSYKTPSGFAKIPLPSPHVGSVVVNSPNSLGSESNLLAGISQNKYFPATSNAQFFPSTQRYSLSPSTTPAPKAVSQTVRYDPFNTFSSPSPKQNTYFSTTESTNRFNTNREITQTRAPEVYRTSQGERSGNGPRLSYNIAGSQFPGRQNVNEEYFNLEKKKKPAVEQNNYNTYKEVTRTPTSTFAQSPSTYEQEEEVEEDVEEVSVSSPAPSTAAVQQTYRGRQPQYTFGPSTDSPSQETVKYIASSTPSTYEKNVEISSIRNYSPIENTRFRFTENQDPKLVNFKLVNSVRPDGQERESFQFVTPRSTTPTTTTTTQKSRYENFERNTNSNENIRGNANGNTDERVRLSANVNTNENFRGASNFNRNNIEPLSRSPPFQNSYSTLQPEIETYSPTAKSKYESVNRNPVNTFSSTYATPTPKIETYSVTTPKPSFENFNRETVNYQNRFSTSRPSSVSVDTRFNDEDAEKQVEEVVSTTQRSYLQSQSTQQEVQQQVTEKQINYVRIAQEAEIQTVAPEEDSQYNLPSELPPISAHLPGLVNSLMEDKWMKKTPIPVDVETTTAAYTTTTRRPITRGRRPLVTRTTTASPASYESVSATTPETTSRRVVQRGRRPVTYAPRVQSTDTVTRAPTERTNIVRNPNKIKHTPTPEERQRFRGRTRTINPGKSTNGERESENLDYQRDVLKQNYPVIKPLATTTTEGSSTDFEDSTSYRPRTSEPVRSSQFNDDADNLVTGTTELSFSPSSPAPPSSKTPDEIIDEINARNFLGLSEPMQIPQERQPLLKENYQSSSFNNINENGGRKLSNSKFENEIRQPIYEQRSTTPATITTEAATVAPIENTRTRRPGFVRRPSRPLFTTTPASPAQTTTEVENVNPERVVINRNNKPGVQRVVRIRSRVRRPVNGTTTAAPIEETTYINRRNSPRYDDVATTQSPVREIIRNRNREYNNNNSNNNNNNNNNDNDDQPAQPKFRVRQRNRFQLDTQESQWTGQVALNSFQPYDPDLKGKAINDYDSYDENEPEIITAENEPAEQTFLFNVSANLAPTAEPLISQDKKIESEIVESHTNIPVIDSTADASSHTKAKVEDDQDEIMENSESSSEVENNESKKTNIDDKKPSGIEKKGRRRGVWRKVRVHPVDAFETAESQNIGNQIINSLVNEATKNEKKNFNEKKVTVEEAVTPKLTEEKVEVETTVTPTLAPAPIETTTASIPEVITTQAAEVQPTIASEDVSPKVEKIEEVVTTIMPEVEGPKEDADIKRIESLLKDSEKPSDDESTEDYDVIFDTEANTERVPIGDDNEKPVRSLFDNVRESLTDLFAMDAAEEEEYFRPMSNKAQYKTIERINPEQRALVEDVSTTTTTTPSPKAENENSMPVTDAIVPMGNILATSTSKQISHETEICYRGRCIKSKSLDSNKS